MTSKEVALITKKNKALEVIGYLANGVPTIKEACAMAGIESRTFDQYLAKFPEIQSEMELQFKSKLASRVSDIMDDKVKNVEALQVYSDTLRERVKDGLLADKAATMLMKIDRHLDQTLRIVLPAQPTESGIQKPPADDASKARANEILAGLRGAKLAHVERKVETYRITLEGDQPDTGTGSADVVDGTLTE
jgi:hypothetical protein